MAKDFFDILSVISHVIGIDQNIIKINYHIYIDGVRKDVIYEVLEGSRSIGKTKRYNRPFKRSIIGIECSLPFVAFSNVN